MPEDIMLIDNEYISLVYLAEKKIIYHTIHQPFGGPDFRAALNLGTDMLAKQGACKWLSDDRKNGPLSDEDRDWGFNDWNRRTIAVGWKYWAIVVPYELYAAGTLTQTMGDLYDIGLRMMVFTTIEEAIRWLDSMED